MPIYAYRCAACGFAKDVLQKVSDAPLTECPSCAKPTFKKQLTAAGFQLKGTGWYVTDFRNNGSGGNSSTSAPAANAAESKGAAESKSAASGASDASASSSTTGAAAGSSTSAT